MSDLTPEERELILSRMTPEERAQTLADEQGAARGLTPDQEELVELDRRRSDVRRELVSLTARLTGFDLSGPRAAADLPGAHLEGIPYEPPSEQEAQILRQQIAALREEEAQLTAQIDRLDAEVNPSS
jgi:uncharacterized protein involved in exopolysaccharide biosynthesis